MVLVRSGQRWWSRQKWIPWFFRLGSSWCWQRHPLTCLNFIASNNCIRTIHLRRPSEIKTLRIRKPNTLSQYRSGELSNLLRVTQEYDIGMLDMQDIRRLGKSILDETVPKPKSTQRVKVCCQVAGFSWCFEGNGLFKLEANVQYRDQWPAVLKESEVHRELKRRIIGTWLIC
jgi:hypothetical protein